MQPHMRMHNSLVTDALRMAWFRRAPDEGVVFHSDRGSQYCGHEFQSALTGYKMKSLMSRKGDCWNTQSKISSSAAFGPTRAGIGVMPLHWPVGRLQSSSRQCREPAAALRTSDCKMLTEDADTIGNLRL